MAGTCNLLGDPDVCIDEMRNLPRGRKSDDFEIFFVQEADRLQRFATFLCGDRDRAAELAQDALARTFSAWKRVDPKEAAAYARRVLVNAFRDSGRRERIRRDRPMATLKATISSSEEPTVERLVMVDALQTLSPARRAVVILRFYEDMSEREIATLLDRPLGTVKSDLHRALKELRPLVSPVYTGGDTHGV